MEELIKLLEFNIDSASNIANAKIRMDRSGDDYEDLVISWDDIKQVLKDYFKDKEIIKDLCKSCAEEVDCNQYANDSLVINTLHYTYRCSGYKEK